MLTYFLIFSLIGFVIGIALKDKAETAVGIIITISVIWGLANAIIWGLATFGELMLGLVIAQTINKNN